MPKGHFSSSVVISAPLFIFQWQFDKFQLFADNMGSGVPASRGQWDSIHSVGSALRGSLSNVTAVFSPACIAHEVLTRSDWESVAVADVSLPDGISCWLQSLDQVDISPRIVSATAAAEVRALLTSHTPQIGSNGLGLPLVESGRFHSRSAAMLSSSRDSYKLASNLVRFLPSAADSSSSSDSTGNRNSIRGHLDKSRRRHRKISNNRAGRRRRPRRRRNRKGGRRRNDPNYPPNHKCHPASNTCEEVKDQEEKTASSPPRNGDLVRTLDRRSSHNQKAQQDQPARGKPRRRTENNSNRRLTKSNERKRKRNREGDKLTKEERRAKKAARKQKRKLRKQRRRERRRRERRRRRKLAEAMSRVHSGQSMASPPNPASQHHLSVRSAERQCASSSSHRYIDECAFPHCNPSCPRLKDPETGQEIGVLALLGSFGLDTSAVARALGVDGATLRAMDKEDLIRMLTSQHRGGRGRR